MASWSDVRRYALALPGAVEQALTSGNRSWVVNKKLFVWERPLRKSDVAALGDEETEGPVLAVITPELEMKDVLIASNPKVFFTIPHFDGYSAVLIRLPKIARAELNDVIVEAWLARAGKRAVAEYLRTVAGGRS